MATKYETARSVDVGVRARIDEGLRAHMNKVYGLMSVAMVITAAAAWAIAGLSTTTNPAEAVFQLSNGTMVNSFGAAIYTGPLKWVIILAPLAMVFLFGAVLNRISAAGDSFTFTSMPRWSGFRLVRFSWSSPARQLRRPS